ncbi:MAG: DUF4301 family protein [Dysgonamonadaceae bacterium]|jgi:hypothetical protein|nr:DUF4301 family protein [Dysgonamonadaceae bacterium]
MNDTKQLEEQGISPAQIEEQLARFKTGFPRLSIHAPASVEKGVRRISEDAQKVFIQKWEKHLQSDEKIMLFIPASGAASRMFKDLFEFLDSDADEPENPMLQKFFENLTDFAFYHELNAVCIENEGVTVHALSTQHRYKEIARNLLSEAGLNYGQLPKALILFHTYPRGSRTAMEEHSVEGAAYACNGKNEVRLHFTVAPQHRALFQETVDWQLPIYAKRFGVKYLVGFSKQKPSTDTIAADAANEPFRDADGRLLFRPGGHGALLENLNELGADVVFIKNVDNVAHDACKRLIVRYKKLLAGVLIDVRQRIFDYLRLIDSGKYSHEQLIEMLYFLQNDLCIKNPETKMLEDAELVLYIKSKLNRPLRICGMVRNEGEPGGGPFLAVNADGTVSPQIVEKSQINMDDAEQRRMFEESAYFNPVDLVCALKNYQGEKFDLPRYADKNTGFISLKSMNGKELRALELPGLWNGAMSDWNTVFVEVPRETFHPVKTIFDLNNFNY